MNKTEILQALKEMGSQKARNEAPKTLFEGALQGNTDQYFRPNNLFSLQSIPAPPKALFCEPGATVETDKRMFMTLQPQVPTNAQQESLNQYFADRRVEEFARSTAKQMAGETLGKQGELAAATLMKEEQDRRMNIRAAVLNATGMTPAQVDAELARDQLAGAVENQTMFDVRDAQVNDAMQLMMNRNNISVPTTINNHYGPGVQNVYGHGAGGMPGDVGGGLGGLGGGPVLGAGHGGLGGAEGPMGGIGEDGEDLIGGEFGAGRAGARGPVPTRFEMVTPGNIAMATKTQLAQFIETKGIRGQAEGADGRRYSTTKADGSMKPHVTLNQYDRTALQSIILDWFISQGLGPRPSPSASATSGVE